MMRHWPLLVLLVAPSLPAAEILDRIVITVGRRAITESDVQQELRLAAFLNASALENSPQARRAAARRLVERALIDAEMQAGRFPLATDEEVDAAISSLRRERRPDGLSFEEALKKYGLAETDVRSYLREQISFMKFLDARFGAAAQVFETDLRDYYLRTFLPEWQNKGAGPPPEFEQVQQELERLIRQQRADVLLEEWLKEASARVRIRYNDETLR